MFCMPLFTLPIEMAQTDTTEEMCPVSLITVFFLVVDFFVVHP